VCASCIANQFPLINSDTSYSHKDTSDLQYDHRTAPMTYQFPFCIPKSSQIGILSHTSITRATTRAYPPSNTGKTSGMQERTSTSSCTNTALLKRTKARKIGLRVVFTCDTQPFGLLRVVPRAPQPSKHSHIKLPKRLSS